MRKQCVIREFHGASLAEQWANEMIDDGYCIRVVTSVLSSFGDAGAVLYTVIAIKRISMA